MKKYIPLIILTLIAAILRLYHLGVHPNGLTWDEAAIGYNTYSLLKTARDEHGVFLPLIFKSFGDYKPGLYIYLTIPSVALLGLTEFATRLPSALFGVLAIPGIYFLVSELSHLNSQKTKSSLPAFFSALILTFNPWHLHYSRGAWETNVFLTFIIFAAFFYLRSIRLHHRLWPAIVIATLTFFVYQSAKMLTPLVFLILIIATWKQFLPRLQKLPHQRLDLIITLICAIITSYLFLINVSGSAGNRLQRLSLFGYRPELSAETIQIDKNNPLTLSLFHSGKDLHLRMVLSRFLYYFSPEVLFYQGPLILVREHINRLGLFHIFDVIIITLGIIYLLRNTSKSIQFIIFSLLIITPIPGSMTIAEYSSTRSLLLVLPLIITAAYGFTLISTKRIFLLGFSLIYIFNIFLSTDIYFNHAGTQLAEDFGYGHKQAIETIINHPTKKVIFTDVYGQPYIFYLFHTKYDPKTYQSHNNFVDGGIDVGFVPSVANLEFHQFSIDDIKNSSDTLFIGTVGNVPSTFDISADFVKYSQTIQYSPESEIRFRIIKT